MQKRQPEKGQKINRDRKKSIIMPALVALTIGQTALQNKRDKKSWKNMKILS